MKLSNKKVSLIVVLITIAFSGLVFLQAVLLKTALKSEEESFNSNVLIALNKAVADISTDEARDAIFQITRDSSIIDDSTTMKWAGRSSSDSDVDTAVYVFKHTIDSSGNIQGKPPTQINNVIDKKFIYLIDPFHSNNQISLSFVDSCYVDGINDGDSVTSGFSYKMEKDGDSVHIVSNFVSNDTGRIMLIEAALNQLNILDTVPIQIRYDTSEIDSALKIALNDMNIDIDYSFGITRQRSDSILLAGRGATYEQLENSIYRTRLNPASIFGNDYYLVVDFPGKQFYIYSKMGILIFPTLIFLIILVGCFIYSIKTILRQRETAVKLTDFINNMTHEFKTPISTIHLAVEALSKDEVINDKAKVKQFNDMILSENSRMKSHVDKILQIATLEEGDYILKFDKTDMHEILNKAIESLSIQLKMQKGQVVRHFDAEISEISGDPVHLINIIHNLLDNALKYSQENPVITISTSNIDNRLVIRVNDNGIGVYEDDLKHLFDKYYRVSHGDVHNVKGFGLGLSYVKMMTEAHHGTAAIASSLGKGTEITLNFPTV